MTCNKFDLIKDVLLIMYMFTNLTQEGSEGKQNSYDYCLVTLSIIAIFIGQSFISAYSFKHRYISFSICPHNTSPSAKIMLTCLLAIFFPLTGLAMSVEKYLDEKDVDQAFKDIEQNEELTVTYTLYNV